MQTPILYLISGALIAGYLLAGLYFFKFWKTSRDPLFVFFAAAFWLLALQRLLLSLSTAPLENQTHLYMLRLLAYLLFLTAIINKNRRETAAPGPSKPVPRSHTNETAGHSGDRK